MSSGIKSDASGTFGALTFGGDDAITFDATGIQAGSYKAGSIDSAALADGALIENAPVGIGYGPGAGGTVTQATSKSTTVHLNKPCGQITMNSASLAAGATATFQLNNSCITAGSDVLVASVANTVSNAPLNYRVTTSTSNLYCIGWIQVTNISGSALAEAVAINFAIIKGTTS